MSKTQKSHCLEQIYSRTRGGSHPVAVALFVHGLNDPPESLRALAESFAEEGIDVFLLTLKGHSDCAGGMDAFRKVHLSDWRDDVAYGASRVLEVAAQRGVPAVALGFSTGATLLLDWMMCAEEPRFERLALLAPAIALRRTSRAMRYLSRLGVIWPSFSKKGYKAAWGTPSAAYRALFEMIDAVGEASASSLSVPARVFIHPKDELVSLPELNDFIQERELGMWELSTVEKSSGASTNYFHVITDPESLGDDSFQKLTKSLIRFFS